MRRLCLLVMVVSAVLAGCLGGPADPEGPPSSNASVPAEGNRTEAADPGIGAPVLADGTAWTYETDGLYNVEDGFTVVVRNRTDGYLFAGETREDLREEIVWDRVWFGLQSPSLNPSTDEGAPARLFDFPLRDGKTWSWAGRDDWPVTARAAEVPTPRGPEPGFEMTMESGVGSRWTWTYAPSVGYVTRLTSEDDRALYYDLSLTEVGTTSEATWYEGGASAGTCAGSDPAATTRLDVTGRDTLVVSTGINGRGSASVTPPATSGSGPVVWVWPGSADDWAYDAFEAQDGTWTLHGTTPDTYACVFARAVTWTPAPGETF